MKPLPPQKINLVEYQPRFFPKNEIREEIGEKIWQNYRAQVDIDFPSPKTQNNWRIMARGWVGYIPLSSNIALHLQPKVPLKNIFQMIDYVYDIKLHLLNGEMTCQSLKGFYQVIARALAKRVLELSHRGFYRLYQEKQKRLPYLRGRLAMASTLQKPGNPQLVCQYQEASFDHPDNQILLWTLFSVIQSNLSTNKDLFILRQAYRSLLSSISLIPPEENFFIERRYHRLNQNYRPLHGLCRFLLETSGPSHEEGEQNMIPFLINMSYLYESFLGEWLQRHLPQPFLLERSQRVQIGQKNNLRFIIDLVIHNPQNIKSKYVIDAKYKNPSRPSNSDIFQVVTYAQSQNCQEAILLYPSHLENPLDEKVGDIRVRSLCFSLDQDFFIAGKNFLKSLTCL